MNYVIQELQDLPAIREWIDITVTNYSKQIGHSKPGIEFDGKREDKHIHSDCEPKSKFCRGISCKKCNTLYVNINKHDTVKEIEDTIVHELVHLRFPKMKEHGEEFFITMGRILEGKHYKRVHRRNRK